MCLPFTVNSFEELTKGLKYNQSLERIDLSYNEIGDECGTIMSRMI